MPQRVHARDSRPTQCRFGRSGFAIGLAMTLAIATLAGCRTDTDDIHRWANTAQGPRKLVAVLTHDKFPLDLRVEAAMTLVRMKPRGGRRTGIQGTDEYAGLVDALAQLEPAERARIIARMVPQLVEAMSQPRPTGEPGKPPPPDESYAYKDAAFALLTHDGGMLIADEGQKRQLEGALAVWAMSDFAARMDESSQMFGMEQVLRELKAAGVRELPSLIVAGAPKIDRMSDLIADLGDKETRLRASHKLVEVAKHIDSDAWLEARAPAVAEANRLSKLNPTQDQFKAQLKQFQEEELLRVFVSMKRVSGPPIVNYLLSFARDGSKPPKRRASALAALEGNLDRNNPAHSQALLALAQDEQTPDEVRDVALRRVGEMPRARVVEQLYSLFKSPNWKVRWVSAELILRMSDTKHIDEFMKRLEDAEGMAITEPLRYGALMGAMKGPPPAEEKVRSHLPKGRAVQARLAAFGYYYEYGTKDDIGQLSSYLADKTKVPSCADEATDCDWKCSVAGERKDVTTVGEFVEYCLQPAMQQRTTADKANAKKEEKQAE